jgi:hypothetical protein
MKQGGYAVWGGLVDHYDTTGSSDACLALPGCIDGGLVAT